MYVKEALIWQFVFGLLIVCCCIRADDQKARCNTMPHLERLSAIHPEISFNIQRFESRYSMHDSRDVTNITRNISIPVVVHIVYHTQEQNLIDAFVETQIQALNDDFRRTNSDSSNTLPIFQDVAADTGINFFLATIDPNRKPTTGITRTATSVISFGDDDRVKFTSFGGKDGWRSDKYLNIWVCNLEKYLGYAQFPHGGSKATDGVVVHYEAFGKPGINPTYGLGRTVTHEVGHWLNLLHIWGSGGCESDDFVSDTPAASEPHYDCVLDAAACGEKAMVQNYMDYTKDNCVNLFTQGQAQRMRALFGPGGPRQKILYHHSFCDNGILEDGEVCDDGNRVDGDGCSSSCNVEQGFRCNSSYGEKSECFAKCPVIFQDDFEEGFSWSKWVPSLIGWHVVNNYNSVSGTVSAFVPNQNTSSNYLLATQPIKLPSKGRIYLWFNMKIRTELGTNGRCPDGGRMLISTDKFQSIRTLTSFSSPYTAVNPLYNGVSWCSYSEYELVSEWKTVFIELSAYAGKTVQIGFHFVTDEKQGGFGWLIDDVKITWDHLECDTYTDKFGVQFDNNVTFIPPITTGTTKTQTADPLPPISTSTWSELHENSCKSFVTVTPFVFILALLVI